jgi:uncharacterized phage protein (TIGR01671 family)
MREIIFKAQRADGKGWVEGYYVFTSNKYHQILTGKWSNRTGSHYSHDVIPETVCQYTGLNDKNGKRIFEGDRLKTDAFDYTYIVKFTDNAFNCYHETLKEWDRSQLKWGGIWRFKEIDAEIEVIGNVHDKNEE